MPAAIPIEVTSEQQRELRRIVTAKTSSQRDVFRARIILGLAGGLSHEEISREQGVSLLAIGRWRKRWAAKGLEGLKDAPGRGRKPTIAASGHPLGPELGCSTGSWRRTLERADDGAGNRLEQIERATFVVGSRDRSASTQELQTFQGFGL